MINCCSRHCSIGNCRTGEGCTRSVGFWRSRVIFCGFGNPGFLVCVSDRSELGSMLERLSVV